MAITVVTDALGDEALEKQVDADIDKFARYFASLGNDNLSGFESSAIKTYLHWKTHGEPDSPTKTPTTEGTDAP